MKYFINFSNHPSDQWSEEQIEAACDYGEIIDLQFPNIDPVWSSEKIKELAKEYVEKIQKYDPAYVLCQGEFTLCFAVVERLKHLGIKVGAACSERKAIINVKEDGKIEKTAIFKFISFRDY